ncbi:zinc ABC transporter substrate-binding protein [Halobacillus salinarum]|uniref:Zinc ABC transporter substrate-binding protein n=1 Tax=Halobacillus salinarum TaxID=2932257 RepID=A0ABY4EL70_9BACI|nr:zinc ABC transporter substrate-binding protein [Halobacillus salinarum]UOQ44312.1 zinc ABC transporter substrate-binding protein [Halobacillus salinarum]
MKKLFFMFLLLMVFGVLSACASNNEEDKSAGEEGEEVHNNENGEKPTVAVSVVPEATFVKKVAEDKVNVVTMIPPGNSPENYEPTSELMNEFSEADAYFSIGVPTEEANILSQKDLNKDMEVVNLADAAAEKYEERQFPSGERDPHVWMSPKRVEVMVDKITEELVKLDPDNEDFYKENASSYKEKLEAADQQIKETLKPMEQRTFIVYHPAFGYFAEDYNLEMVPLQEEGKEAAPKKMEEIIDLAKEKDIKTIFYQEEMSSKQAEAVAEAIGGQTEQISPLNPNYIDNLEKMADTFKRVLEQ